MPAKPADAVVHLRYKISELYSNLLIEPVRKKSLTIDDNCTKMAVGCLINTIMFGLCSAKKCGKANDFGNDAELTFQSQSTCVLPVVGERDAFIFMADRWNPDNPIDGRYVWLPVVPKPNMFHIAWKDFWDLSTLNHAP